VGNLVDRSRERSKGPVIGVFGVRLTPGGRRKKEADFDKGARRGADRWGQGLVRTDRHGSSVVFLYRGVRVDWTCSCSIAMAGSKHF
jgi:hypothetical protein